MKDDASHGQGLKSLDTALGVLALMARYPAPQALSDIARDAGMTPSKAYRYLASFVQAGLVKQEGRSGRYGIGPEALRLGVAAIAQHDFVSDAAEGLADLVADTGMTALLSVWANEGGTVVRWERGATPTDTATGLGTTLPLLNSATGHAFLAWAPAAIVKATAEKQMRQLAKNPAARAAAPTTKAELTKLIEDVRARGYASAVGNFIPGLVAVAAPILDWQGEAQAVVTLVGVDPDATRTDSATTKALLSYSTRKSFDFH
ncbi:MAG: IclR family transcriptional regulator [Pseudomonadota bacterium]